MTIPKLEVSFPLPLVTLKCLFYLSLSARCHKSVNCPPPCCHQPKFFYQLFKFCNVILGLSFKFQTFILWNGWDSLTNHCFFGGPHPRKKNLRNTFLPKWMQKKFGPYGWKAAEFIVHRVTEWQSDRLKEWHHFHSLYGWGKFFMSIFNKLPYLLHSQGDN